MGLTSSIFIPNGRTKIIQVLINGRETEKINVDLNNVKCPVCGSIMCIREVNCPEEDRNYSVCVHNSYSAKGYSERERITDKVGLECPNCEALLYLKRTVIMEIGYRVDNYNRR